jgi:hypothetical protein
MYSTPEELTIICTKEPSQSRKPRIINIQQILNLPDNVELASVSLCVCVCVQIKLFCKIYAHTCIFKTLCKIAFACGKFAQMIFQFGKWPGNELEAVDTSKLGLPRKQSLRQYGAVLSEFGILP